MIIRTERLLLRPFEPSEADILHSLWTLPPVRRHLWDDRVIPPERTAGILDRSRDLFDTDGLGLWSLREDESPDLVGFGGYWHFRDPGELELVLGVHPSRWHEGLATEAGRALIRYGFESLGLDGIRGSTDAPNAASIRLMERLGMTFERREVVDGLDTVFYRLDREETPG